MQEGCYSAGNNEEKGNSFLPEKVVCWFTYHSEDIKTLHLR
ncbi:hypothetical protein SeW_A4755 [Salmonella enterica subsp. enterica serovar Weltevreden str. HI_N05-537]|nr:hypothetical protein SeW_A4755 [Salmonella enterica subsp. enterica serovar Weltevreden str. HI_N05-537]